LWQEIRADAKEAETLLAIRPLAPGRDHGADLTRPEHRAKLATVIRYHAMAGNAVRRALGTFLAARNASRKGLLLPAADMDEQDGTNELSPVASAEPAAAVVEQKCTNELPAAAPPEPVAAAPEECTNELPTAPPEPVPPAPPANDDAEPAPPLPLHARVRRLLDRTEPRLPEELDLAEAICALRWPDWPPYRGGIDLAALARVLEAVRLDDAALHWLGSRELEQACRRAAGSAGVPGARGLG
jgi:hypothetical protein